MARTHRSITAAVLAVGLISVQATSVYAESGALSSPDSALARVASQHDTAVATDSAWLLRSLKSVNFGPSDAQVAGSSTIAAGQSFEQVYRRGSSRGRRRGSLTAIMIGTATSIAGGAILTYANRPECSVNRFADGCGYGTKVIGGAVLTGGLATLMIGALTWR